MRRVLSWVGTAVFLPTFVAILLVFDVAQRIARLFGQRPQEYVAGALQVALVAAFRLCGTRLAIERAPGVRRRTSYVIVSNHQSMFDIPILGSLLFSTFPKYISKRSLGRWIPSVSYNLRRGGHVLIDRGDYFQIAFDPQHRANVAFSDDSKVNTEVGPDNGADNPTTRRKIRANFTHQITANPNIVPVTTGTCAGPPPGAENITGGRQIASQTPGLTANFGFVAMNANPNASLSYHDDGATGGSIDVHSTNTSMPSVTFKGNCSTFKGDAKVNQKLGYKYAVNACDNAEPGAGKDTFSISITGPNFSYSNGGFITSGDIQIHKQ